MTDRDETAGAELGSEPGKEREPDAAVPAAVSEPVGGAEHVSRHPGDGNGGGSASVSASMSASPSGAGTGSDKLSAWSQIKDAITLRSVLLVIGTLALGVGFIASYVGGLHHPAPKNLPFDVVAPAEVQGEVVAGLAALPGQPLTPRLIPDAATAHARVADRTSTGALIIDPTSNADTLYVASAAGPSISNALTRIIGQAEAAQHRTLNVQDLVPISSEDSGGLSTFYLAVGGTVAGYLIAAILGISAGTRPATPTRAAIRLGALALSAIVAGIVGVWIVQHVLGALPGSYWPLAATVALLVFGAGALTMALQIAFGVIGIGVAVLLFVILGNPAAGGAYARALLPPFWRAIGAYLPPGAGTDAARSIAYFGGARTAQPLYVLACYAVVGLLLTLGLATLVRPKPKA